MYVLSLIHFFCVVRQLSLVLISTLFSVPAISLLKVHTYKLKEAAVRLSYCTVLIGILQSGRKFHVSSEEEEDWSHIISK